MEKTHTINILSSIRDNRDRGSVGQFLLNNIKDNSNLSIVSAYFTIYAYGKLKEKLNNINELKFLFGEPTFLKSLDPNKTNKRNFKIEDEKLVIPIESRLTQKALAKECSDWIKEKVQIKSMIQPNFLHGKMHHIIQQNEVEKAAVGSSNFTVNGLGLGGRPNIELNMLVDNDRDRTDLKNCFSATRPYKPRDKAMVEKTVNIIYNNIYGPLRKHEFYSIGELNAAIAIRLEILNHKKYKGSAFSRRELFNQNEKNLLTILPSSGFQLKKTILATVQRNYHIQLSENHHYYSVPYTYTGKKVKVLYDNKTVEIYFDHARIAVHERNTYARAYHTIDAHMPINHQQAKMIKGWTKEDLLIKARYIGPNTEAAAAHILSGSIYPVQNFKSCHGVIMLQNKYGKQRVENACKRSLLGTRINYTSIRSILEKGLDKQTELFTESPLPAHDNIRGPEQYQ